MLCTATPCARRGSPARSSRGRVRVGGRWGGQARVAASIPGASAVECGCNVNGGLGLRLGLGLALGLGLGLGSGLGLGLGLGHGLVHLQRCVEQPFLEQMAHRRLEARPEWSKAGRMGSFGGG